MARFANPSRISLSLVWTAYSCLKISLKSDHRGWSCSSSSQIDHWWEPFSSRVPEWVGQLVVGLSVWPPVCFCKILQSPDKICSRNGVLAFGSEKLRTLVLFNSEVEVGHSRSISCAAGGSRCSIGVLVVAIVIVMVVFVVVVFAFNLDVISSNKGNFWSSFVFLDKAIHLFLHFCGFLCCVSLWV